MNALNRYAYRRLMVNLASSGVRMGSETACVSFGCFRSRAAGLGALVLRYPPLFLGTSANAKLRRK